MERNSEVTAPASHEKGSLKRLIFIRFTSSWA
jgi:hypothetical protein